MACQQISCLVFGVILEFFYIYNCFWGGVQLIKIPFYDRFGRLLLCPYEAFGKFYYLCTHFALHYFICYAMATSFKSCITRRLLYRFFFHHRNDNYTTQTEIRCKTLISVLFLQKPVYLFFWKLITSNSSNGLCFKKTYI